MRLPRAPLFLAERIVSQGGGLLFTAILARTAEPDQAATFLAAYAFAAIFQPVLSSAVQPIAARHWRAGGLSAVIRIWAVMQLGALCIVGPLIWLAEGRVEAFILLHAALAPGLLMATPLAAEDRRQTLVMILIAAASLGTAARVGAYLATGDLAFAALFFAFEPVVGGAALLLASRRLSPSQPAISPGKPFLREAATMAVAMTVTTVFWRSPVLLADRYLEAADVIALALAMQLIMGLCLPANALCQSLFGPIAKGDRSAIGVGVWIAIAMGLAAPLFLAGAGEWIMAAIYGPLGQGAAIYAMMLAPMAGLAALLRLGHIVGGLNGLSAELAVTRAAALLGQAALAIWLIFAPSALAIAAVTPVSLMLAVIAAPLATPGLAALAREAALSAKQIALHAAARRQALRLMFS